MEAACVYMRRGWCVVPVPFKQKRPILKGWRQLRLEEADLQPYFDQPANVGLMLGEPSGWLVDVDLDCDEAIHLADEFLPATPVVTGRPSKPRSHRWYCAEGAVTRKHSDPVTRKMIVELRSTGGQTVVGPSLHPEGEHYEVVTGEPAIVDAQMLADCVEALAKRVIELRHGSTGPVATASRGSHIAESRTESPPNPIVTQRRSLTPAEIEHRALAYLAKIPPAISGQGGHNTAYTAATVLVHGFEIDPDRALSLLLESYNPRCEPPWSEHELRHKCEDAATKPHSRPRGWLLEQPEPVVDADVDISAILERVKSVRTAPESDPFVEAPVDPGPIPDDLLHVPGFVSQVMDFTLANAPYQNVALAFCGAMALQSYLCGRKVCDPGDLRPNIYLLALASSGTGKDFPRAVNAQVLLNIGHVPALGDKFASGEGIQDALHRAGAMLFQNDEMDGVLRQINLDRENKRESIPNILLTLYTSAANVYPIRVKAGQKEPQHIDQPHLTLFGTATPKYFYEALSPRMLTNGFFARMIIVDVGSRGAGQSPGSARLVPEPILETARWWAEFQPGTVRKNLIEFHPDPKTIPYTADAERAVGDLQRLADAE
ncbi:MAG: bifunctional DNA primase/polymerase [Planctomycetaceae bacterium]